MSDDKKPPTILPNSDIQKFNDGRGTPRQAWWFDHMAKHMKSEFWSKYYQEDKTTDDILVVPMFEGRGLAKFPRFDFLRAFVVTLPEEYWASNKDINWSAMMWYKDVTMPEFDKYLARKYSESIMQDLISHSID